MMGRFVHDPDGIEGEPGKTDGLGLLVVDCLSGIIARLSPLSPYSYTLHVPLDAAHSDNTKTVSLEVFAFDDLASSLDFLEHRLLLTGAHF